LCPLWAKGKVKNGARELDWITVYFDGGPQVVHGKKSEVKKWFSIKGYLN
jgi:hypothetical protein